MFLKLYIDGFSQPARALMMFVRATKIPREEIEIRIGQGQHRTEAYAKVNPFKKIPAIDHNGFKLGESVAIFRYLCRTFPVDDHWYPADSAARARVDEYLEWQHLGLRIHVSRHFASILIPEVLGMNKYEEKVTKKMEDQMLKAMDDVENVFLKRNPYVGGSKISIADLMAVGELEQPRLVNYDVRSRKPEIGKYLDRIKEELSPHYDEVHKALRKFQALRAQTEAATPYTPEKDPAMNKKWQ